MKETSQETFNSTFAAEVKEGLTSFPKYLNSKYFYDAKGDSLFQDIMDLPEYYLTNCEFEILSTHKKAIASLLDDGEGFDLIELGAGDGKKTAILLEELLDQKIDFDYLPIDISQNILDSMEKILTNKLPNLKINTQQGTYFDVLQDLDKYNKRKKVILVLGSNIGNLNHEEAIDFLKNIQKAMSGNDVLFIGFDQKKNPETIRDAYMDSQGVTEAFNKNVLERINREFKADFNLNKFQHWQSYNPESGRVDSFLVSKTKQQVQVPALDLTIEFEPWESIHTEISQKYTDDVVRWLSGEADLKISESFTDSENYYKNHIFRR